MPTIYFYETDKPYGCLSNFARFPIVVVGSVWPTSEHFFQSSKFQGQKDQEDIRAAPTPFVAAKLGRDRSRKIRTDWEGVRDTIMAIALSTKFQQHEEPRQVLLSTGNSRLVEHTPNDSYWADGGDGSGRNRLGELLMELRRSYANYKPDFFVPPWIKFPEVDVSDFHWRMGSGEDYLIRCSQWLQALTPSAKREYDAYFPVPNEWIHSW
jgi:N-glycosidase YbiA